MKKSPRTIAVKMLLNPDEFVEFDGACAAADVSHSRAARDLVKGWVTQLSKDKGQASSREWPGAAQNMAMLLPSRRPYGAPTLHMRL